MCCPGLLILANSESKIAGGIHTNKSTEELSTHRLLAMEPNGTTDAEASRYVVTTEVISDIKREAFDTNCFDGRIELSWS
jgi:hypothetical protein